MTASSHLSQAIVHRLHEQLERFPFEDITIEVRGTPFKCHRFHLSACSRYFRGIFETQNLVPQVIRIIEIDPETFRLVLGCVYGAQENFTVENVASLWNAAEFLQIDFLCEACEEFQYTRLSKECCVDILNHAKTKELTREVLDKARRIMVEEFDYLRQRDDLLALDFKELKMLVSSDSLSTDSEDDVFEIILKWTSQHGNEDSPGQEAGDLSTTVDARVVRKWLPELLKSARLYLVSGTYLENLLDERCVVRNPAAFEIVREALRYHLQPGRRHEYCPPYAIHRNRSPLQNVTVVISLASNGHYIMSCRTQDGSWYELTQPPQLKVSAVTYENDLYMVSASTRGRTALRYNLSSCSFVSLTNLSIQREGCILVCVDSYIYIIGGINDRSIDRFNVKEEQRNPYSVRWERVGNLHWDLTNVMATVMGKNIVVFGKRTDSTLTSVQSFNTSTMTTQAYTHNYMGEHASMVSFKNGKDTFVLLETGHLWQVLKCDNQDLEMMFRGQLFNERLSLHGATVFNESLLILATNINRATPREFITSRIENVPEVKLIEREGVCFLNTVIARQFLTERET